MVMSDRQQSEGGCPPTKRARLNSTTSKISAPQQPLQAHTPLLQTSQSPLQSQLSHPQTQSPSLQQPVATSSGPQNQTQQHHRQGTQPRELVGPHSSAAHLTPSSSTAQPQQAATQQGLDPAQKDPREQCKASVRRCVQFLVHASQCRDPLCTQPGCINIKRVLEHFKNCTLRASVSCVICKTFLLLCYFHAKSCIDDKCLVLLCTRIKKKLQQRRTRKQMEQSSFMHSDFKQVLADIPAALVPPTHLVPINIVSQPTKEWHLHVNPHLRQNHLRKIAEVIYSYCPIALQDPRVAMLIQTGEKATFERATSQEEYRQILTEKTHRIRKQVEARRTAMNSAVARKFLTRTQVKNEVKKRARIGGW